MLNFLTSMQLINLVRWLQDVVEGLGGTTFVARQELVRELDIKRVHISFQIPVRHRWYQDKIHPRRYPWFQSPQWVERHPFGQLMRG